MNYRTCFAACLRRQGKKPSTIRTYSYALADFMKYCHSFRKSGRILKDFNPQQLEVYKGHLIRKIKLRPSTVNNRLTALSAFARFLLERSLLGYNPLELVSRLNRDGTSKARPRAAWEEVQATRREVKQHFLDLRSRLIVELLCTGITVKELLTLRLDSVEAIQIGKRRIKLHPEAQRAVSQTKVLHSILLSHSLIEAGNGLRWFLKPSMVYATLRRISKKIEARITVHDLRLAQFALLPDGAIYDKVA